MKKPTEKPAAKTVVPIEGKRHDSVWSRATRTLKAKPGDERRAALARLGVSEEQVEKAMPISHMLREGGCDVEQALNAMRFVQQDDPLIRQFLDKWNTISEHDRHHVSFEALALSCNIFPPNLYGSVGAALWMYNKAILQIMLATGHREVVAARQRFGRLPAGAKDRTALDQAVGLLPQPHGATFINRATIFGSGKSVMDQQRKDADDNEEPVGIENEVDLDKIFPPPNKTQEKLIAIRNRTHQLPEPKKDTGKKPN